MLVFVSDLRFSIHGILPFTGNGHFIGYEWPIFMGYRSQQAPARQSLRSLEEMFKAVSKGDEEKVEKAPLVMAGGC
jgi:hypothetical protein